ncbi:MAG TPA: gluconokinase [Stellaceae bacterium]|nr:gluconokinase [Stellaceae bacterium]
MTGIVVMGVSGVGKTTVGELLAKALGLPFLEGDRFHSPASVEKMHHGEPLNDADRWPWLDRIAAELARLEREGKGAVVACSALKRAYRDRLRSGSPGTRFVYLEGSEALIRERLGRRRGHFMPPALLASQFAALEPPSPEENAVIAHVGPQPTEIVAGIVEALSPP